MRATTTQLLSSGEFCKLRYNITSVNSASAKRFFLYQSVAYRGGFGGFNTPPEIPKALQNRAKLNPILKTVKNC